MISQPTQWAHSYITVSFQSLEVDSYFIRSHWCPNVATFWDFCETHMKSIMFPFCDLIMRDFKVTGNVSRLVISYYETLLGSCETHLGYLWFRIASVRICFGVITLIYIWDIFSDITWIFICYSFGIIPGDINVLPCCNSFF